MTNPRLLPRLTPGCHQNPLSNLDRIVAEPLPIRIQRNPIHFGRISLLPGYRAKYLENTGGSLTNTVYSTRGRR